MTDVPLRGGRTTPGVVRVADTVRRPQKPRAPFVHQLLLHLERAGFEAAPRFLGIDEQGREILSFRAGLVPRDLQPDHGDEVLRAVARLIRRFHDAVAGTRFADGEEVVCHDDLSPVNTVFEDGTPVALIDFDNACPGPRIRDLAYAIFLWLDLWEEGSPLDEQARRTGVFLDAYGIEVSPTDLIDAILAVQRATAARCRADGVEDGASWWGGAADWLEANRDEYEEALAFRTKPPRTSSTAGAIVLHGGALVVTLNTDHLPSGLDDGTWLRVGGVGGGCEPGELCFECAEREAREELTVEVELVSSPVTFRSGEAPLKRIAWPRDPAPFVWDERGNYSGALFAARLKGQPRPGDDVVALLLLRPGDWGLLEESPTVADAEAAGMQVIEARPLARETRLWVDPDEAMRAVAPLIERHPEVFGA
jgi:ADP-ribose pyrophosphatase YjhB (NUDIX family)